MLAASVILDTEALHAIFRSAPLVPIPLTDMVMRQAETAQDVVSVTTQQVPAVAFLASLAQDAIIRLQSIKKNPAVRLEGMNRRRERGGGGGGEREREGGGGLSTWDNE